MFIMAVNRNHSTPTAQRRQTQIEDCLFEKMQTTPWQSISVADICRNVGISRKAYYNYYKDKEACFCGYIDRVIQESLLYATQSLSSNLTPMDAIILVLDFWKSKKVFLDLLKKNNQVHLLVDRCVSYALHEDRSVLQMLNTESLPTDTDILSCYVAIQINLIVLWHNRNFDTPTEIMAKKLMRIMFEPLIKLIGP
jgi:AcrR family transcriptional regulator